MTEPSEPMTHATYARLARRMAYLHEAMERTTLLATNLAKQVEELQMAYTNLREDLDEASPDLWRRRRAAMAEDEA